MGTKRLRLDDKDLKFAWLIGHRGLKPRDAYYQVYKPKSDSGLTQKASQKACKIEIRELIDKYKARYLAALEAKYDKLGTVTNKGEVINNLIEISKEARADGQYSPAVQAQKLLGQTVGLFQEHKGLEAQTPVINISCNIPQRPQIESKVVEILDESPISKKTP